MFSRTRKKRDNKKSINSIVISLFIFLLIGFIILYLLINFIHNKYVIKNNFEKDISATEEEISDTTFSLSKIVFYSNANAITNDTSRDLWNLNIYQYTDIALYLKSDTENLTSKNTIKEMWIDNINFSLNPERGTPKLFYKDIKNFGSPNLIDSNLISDRLNFNIINPEQELDTSTPNFYNTYQVPIVLSYVNEKIKENAIIPNTNTPLNFNGSLLSKANIPLNSIACTFSFNINIVNNLDEKFKNTVTISIPLEDNEMNIYNGFIKKDLTDIQNNIFFKCK